MNALVSSKLDALSSVCVKRRVTRLALFGSAATDGYTPGSSDMDFIVEFEPMEPKAYADNYFGLLDDLEHLFGVAIDLVEYGPIKNPYFKKEIEETRVVVYEAA